MDHRYYREHNNTHRSPYSSESAERDYRASSSYYSPRRNSRSSGYYYGGRAFEVSYPSHFRYNQQIPYGSPSNVNPPFFGSSSLVDIMNEPIARAKPKIPMYSPENEELWNHYRMKEGSSLRENEVVLRKDVRAMEKALKDSLQTYERENRCHLLIKRQIETLLTPEEIEELNLLADKNNKNDPLSL